MIIEQKRTLVAAHFTAKWNSPIAQYVGKSSVAASAIAEADQSNANMDQQSPRQDASDYFDLSFLSTAPRPPTDLLVEAQRLGIPPSALASLELNRDLAKAISDSWTITLVARRVRQLADTMGIAVSDAQARAVATNRCVPHFAARGPLTVEERRIGAELLARAFRDYLKRRQSNLSFEESQREAERMVAFGERGVTALHKIGDAVSKGSGCLVAIAFAAIGVAVLLLSGSMYGLQCACFVQVVSPCRPVPCPWPNHDRVLPLNTNTIAHCPDVDDFEIMRRVIPTTRRHSREWFRTGHDPSWGPF